MAERSACTSAIRDYTLPSLCAARLNPGGLLLLSWSRLVWPGPHARNEPQRRAPGSQFDCWSGVSSARSDFATPEIRV